MTVPAGLSSSRACSKRDGSHRLSSKTLGLTLPVRLPADPQFTEFVNLVGENYQPQRVDLSMLPIAPSTEIAPQFLFPSIYSVTLALAFSEHSSAP